MDLVQREDYFSQSCYSLSSVPNTSSDMPSNCTILTQTRLTLSQGQNLNRGVALVLC